MTDKDHEIPTVKWGESGCYEDWLVGNRRGFSALRDRIDEMLVDESDAPMPDSCDFEFRGLSCSLRPEASVESDGAVAEKISGAGCLLAFICLSGLIGLDRA